MHLTSCTLHHAPYHVHHKPCIMQTPPCIVGAWRKTQVTIWETLWTVQACHEWAEETINMHISSVWKLHQWVCFLVFSHQLFYPTYSRKSSIAKNKSTCSKVFTWFKLFAAHLFGHIGLSAMVVSWHHSAHHVTLGARSATASSGPSSSPTWRGLTRSPSGSRSATSAGRPWRSSTILQVNHASHSSSLNSMHRA